MTKSSSQLYLTVIISTAIAFFLAGSSTHIQYTCISSVSEEGCVSFEKAVMHPSDLIDNKQDSLTNFVGTLMISWLVSFVLLSVYGRSFKKKA